MAVYFDHRVQTIAGSQVDISWHNTQPFLAVATRTDGGGGTVKLYNEEGDEVENACVQRSCGSSSLSWHPVKPIFASGWESGDVLVWNDESKELYEAPALHKKEVCLVVWNDHGQRLMTGDKNGDIVIWKVDMKGRIQPTPVCQYECHQIPRQCIFRPTSEESAQDKAALARAAVSGDERALDMFSWRKESSKSSKLSSGNDGLCCYVASEDGDVNYFDEKGNLFNVHKCDGPIKKLLYNEHRNILVIITDALMLSQHSVLSDGKLQETMKVKLSGKPPDTDCAIVWAGKGLLATATGEGIVRMWDLDKDDNFVLGLDTQSGFETGECINCVAYCKNKAILAAGTDRGRVAFWKYSPNRGLMGRKQDSETKWKLQKASNLEGSILQIKWGSRKNLLATNTIDQVTILDEQLMSGHMKDEVCVVQTGPNTLSVDLYASKTHHNVKTDIHVKGIYASKEHVVIWNGRKAVVYEVGQQAVRASGTFSTESSVICLYEQNVYTTEPGKIQVRTFQGTVKQLISLNEDDGEPVAMEISDKYFVVATSTGFIKVYDISRREAKPHCPPKNFAEIIPDLRVIKSAKSNSNGTRIFVIVEKTDGTIDSKLYLWDVDMDTIQYFDFATGQGDQDDVMLTNGEDMNDVERGRVEAAQDVAGRYPVSAFWDPTEPKLIVCEARLALDSENISFLKKKPSLNTLSNLPAEKMVVSLFSTLDHGVMLQGGIALHTAYDSLLGAGVPYLYFVKKSGEKLDDDVDSLASESPVARKVMRDFVGLEDSDKKSREAMMNFSFYLTIGNMDEAFKAIKLIKSESVWENMAMMCVKTRRLDVAKVCLGNMGHARGARALREAEKEPELDARVAMLAIQLGLLEDAERLYKNCGRYDLLNQFYQASGQWAKAMETAELHDRIHLRTTYYNYAKHLESKGDMNGAIPNYEKSDTHRFEIPRMLFDEPQALKAYIMKTKDKSLKKWWAQYMESTSEMDSALQFYEMAQDYLSLVRVYCYCNNLEKASEIASQTGDRAACYHLARQYENVEDYKASIHFFTRAQAYSQAIRLCKENNMEDQLMNLALMSNSTDMIDAAQYYESNPQTMDKAVMLYHKGGHFSKALELAFDTQQFAALQLIAEDLDEKTDPILLNRCADFFMEHGQYDKAVDLLVVAKKFGEALDICMQQGVNINEKLAEKMTISKDDPNGEMRIRLLEKVADICFQQGSYHLATKKYTQAGNKAKAMKSLLKSGDTEKIIFFAGVSRQKEIYVMAANYLQSLDWRKDPEIMKNIIGFYTRGRALDSLSGFYDACAQVEIDEYQNYDKALGALSEAYKCLSKAKLKNTSQQEEKLAALKHRINLVKKFVQARRVYDEEPEEAMKQCQVLLEEHDLDSAVRVGDVYGMMIEHYARQESFKKAYACMEEMRSRIPTVNMAFYVNMRTIEAIHRALDIPLGRGMGAEKKDEDDGDEVEEEVQEEYDEDNGYC
ncbi:intraflagellar transport protein 140 homolog [Anneissia japonica]|uniref:intraflagellar transport protein 140 homolog n=1 Tax=Anneissia japonica TaxID=1529436 RepID=UPI001425BA25|nr:intraflagellar transport protein 140 homolog [Anneissia japonica]XP_033108708.1 intraflagellar transport protein 140 homolog [Anneissia japonica]